MYSNYILFQEIVYFNFFFLFFSIFITSLLYYFCFFFKKEIINRMISTLNYIKYLIILSLFISMLIHLFTIFTYVNYSMYLTKDLLTNTILFTPFSNLDYFFFFKFSIDFFGLILLLLAYLVGFISIIVLDTRLSRKNIKFIFTFNIFSLIVYFYVTTTNILLFFLYYELLLLLSFLFVYFISPSKRAIQASIYFIVWTQIGSLIVLFAIAYIISITNITDLNYLRFFYFNTFESFFIYLLLFIGFGVKVPIWPFHYWLTKTHVEAPSGFSIYLSGFLVKTAVYGFYKITTTFYMVNSTSFFVSICLIGVIDSSLKMWGQTDLKKLVAYGTIQEMNLIFLVFCWGDSSIIGSGIFFCVTHALLSALMFYLVDCLYRRFHTRSLIEINGLLHLTPNLAISILMMIIFFAGLPGTLKFSVEFYIFSAFLSISPFLSFFIMFIANVIGLIGFSKCWFNSVFGLNKKWLELTIIDLNLRELFIIFLCFFFLILFSFISFSIF